MFRLSATFTFDAGKTFEYSYERLTDGSEVSFGESEVSRLYWDADALVVEYLTAPPERVLTMSWRYESIDSGQRLRASEQIRMGGRNDDNVWVFERYDIQPGVTSMSRRIGQLGGLGLLVGVLAGCGFGTEPDCLMPPCPMPMAIVMNATSAAGGPVASLSVAISGAVTGSAQCSAGSAATTCYVPGTAGTYTLRLTAAGFEEKTLSVAVAGNSPPCSCSTVETRRIDVVLTPK